MGKIEHLPPEATAFYEEKVFDGEVWWRTTPDGAFRRKIPLNSRELFPETNKLLDFLRKYMGWKTDAELGRALGYAPPVISKLRIGKLRLTDLYLLRAQDVTGLHANELRSIAGLPVPKPVARKISGGLAGSVTEQ